MNDQAIGKSPETKNKTNAFEINKTSQSVGTKNGFKLYEDGQRVYSPANKPTASDVGAASKSELSTLENALYNHSHSGYAPSSHTHSATDVGSLPVVQTQVTSNLNDVKATGIYDVAGSVTNGPFGANGCTMFVLNFGNTYCTQTAYHPTTNEIRVRTCNNGTWSSWKKVYNEDFKPTASEVGAVSANNSTLTGTTNLETLNLSGLTTSSKTTLRSASTSVYVGNTGITGLYLETKSGYAYVKHGSTNYRIYHEGYKPNSGGSDPGASPASWPVGSYAFLRNNSSSYINAGDTLSGSSLAPSSAGGLASGYTSGVWRCMGYAYPANTSDLSDRSTLWVRIS